ncbi:MAG: penicillin acylase family protein [Bacteroidota bacterium]
MLVRVSLFALVFHAAPSFGQAAQDLTLDYNGRSVTIERDAYGVPHITSDDEAALFFGQGFAIAQDRLFQMETFWRTATGRLAEIQGAAAVQQDRNVRAVYYTPDEREDQFEALSEPVRIMMDAYIAGINTYIDSTDANAATYLPVEYAQSGIPIEDWNRDMLVATLQFFMRRFGEIGGDELTRMAELEAQGAEWFEANLPVNDPAAATTISNATRPRVASSNAVRGLNRYPEGTAAFARAASEHLRRQRAADEALLRGLGVPLKFGSFAAVIDQELSASNAVILLGAPQMGAPEEEEKAVTSEVELVGPNFHVAGMTVPGIPGVVIGRTEDRVWTLTTGFTDNTDTYMVVDQSATSIPPMYEYGGETRAYEVNTGEIIVRDAEAVPYTHLRTIHGPVYFQQGGLAAAYKYAFWDRELEMVEAFYDAWNADSIEDFEAVAESVTMSFNLFYADRDQNIAFWHVGAYPRRPGVQDPRLPAPPDGSGEWIGMLDFAEHPQQVNPDKGYFVNWNNKPAGYWNQGDNVPWTNPGGRNRLFDGVTYLDAHIRESAGGGVTFEEVQELTRVVRSNPKYQEYPGTYQQVVELGAFADGRAENVIPPGQSGFVSSTGIPSPNFSDQWALYQSSEGTGEIQMKPFTFTGQTGVSTTAPADQGIRLNVPAPNPSQGRAQVTFELDASSTVRLTVVDALGREVAELANGDVPVGAHSAALPELAPGVYHVRLAVGSDVVVRRAVVVR